jgi:hypothetical protein
MAIRPCLEEMLATINFYLLSFTSLELTTALSRRSANFDIVTNQLPSLLPAPQLSLRRLQNPRKMAHREDAIYLHTTQLSKIAPHKRHCVSSRQSVIPNRHVKKGDVSAV